MPLLPPSQPTQAPGWTAITGRSAVTRPPGESSQPLSPCCTGSRLATAITGLPWARVLSCVTVLSCPTSSAPEQTTGKRGEQCGGPFIDLGRAGVKQLAPADTAAQQADAGHACLARRAHVPDGVANERGLIRPHPRLV